MDWNNDFVLKVENFSNLLEVEKWEEKILFSSWKYVWFSIKKEYSNFDKLVKNKNWNIDNFCLIRLWYKYKINENLRELYIDCSLQSKLLQENPWNNFSSLDSNSLELFNNSRIPFSLNSIYNKKYLYNVENNKFSYKNKEVSIRFIINDIYNSHLNSSKFLRYYFYKWVVNIWFWFLKIWEFIFYKFWLKLLLWIKFKDEDTWLVKWIFWQIHSKKDFEKMIILENKDFDAKNHLDNTEIDIPFFWWKLKINKRWLLFSIITLSILAIFFQCSYIIKILENYKDNEVILWSLVLFWIIIFHIIFEFILNNIFINLFNFSIKLNKFINDKISINWYDFDLSSNPYKNNF